MERVKGLKCRECGRGYPASAIHVCEFCFGPLEVDYDVEAIRARVSRARIEAGPPSIWRYADLLPVDQVLAGVAGVRPGQDLDQGGLAGPVLAG